MPDVGRQLHVDHERGLHSVLAEDTAVREAVVDGPGGLAVVPGDRDLASFADADPARLRKVFNLLGIAYDVVLVDTAPGLQNEGVMTYQAVDGVVLVTTPEPNAVEDMEKTGQLAADVGADLLGAVVTHGEGRRAREAASELDSGLLGVVPHHTTGGPITAVAPDDAAADAYRRIGAALPAVDAEAVVPDHVSDVARSESGADGGADGTVSADSDTGDADGEPTAADASENGDTDGAVAAPADTAETGGPDAENDDTDDSAGTAGAADDSDGTEPVVDGDRAESADAEPDERVEGTDGTDAVASAPGDDTERAGSDTAESRLTAEIPRATAVAGDGPDEADGSSTDETEDDVLDLVDDAVESATEAAGDDDGGAAADLDDESDGFDLGSNGSGS
jgi:septum site-determining protein MinD